MKNLIFLLLNGMVVEFFEQGKYVLPNCDPHSDLCDGV
jgi:hypothetical protein